VDITEPELHGDIEDINYTELKYITLIYTYPKKELRIINFLTLPV
jgi:hypothetical protein